MTNVVPLNPENEDREHDVKSIEAFNAAAARYQRAQSDITKPEGKDRSDKRLDRLMDRHREALWEVIRARAVLPHQIDFKFAILRELIDGSGWVDGRDRFLLESLRLDVGL